MNREQIVRFILACFALAGVVAFWDAPSWNTWQFWAGALCIGIYRGLDWRT